MEDKYISFSPYYSGLANVIMCYELAFAISHITGRTLIVPPNCFLTFMAENDRKTFIDIWKIFDRDYVNKNCNCVDFHQVPEFQEKYHLFGDIKSYTNGISEVIDDVTEIKFISESNPSENNCPLNESHQVIISSEYSDDDFADFCQDRKVLDLSKIESKFIHFEGNLFGHYWYHVYPGNFEQRNAMKEKINTIFKYNSIFEDICSFVSSSIGNYNSAHIRRNDFLHCRKNEIETISSDLKVLNSLKQYFDVSVPLYIATDEKNKDFFNLVKNEFRVYFFDDIAKLLPYDINELEKTIIEQIICAKSSRFYGTFYSTYSSRINIIRGINGMQAEDYMGLNYIGDIINDSLVNPWKYKENRRWGWWDSSHPQWKVEKNGIYV